MAEGGEHTPRLVTYRPAESDRILYLNPVSASIVVTNDEGHRAITGYLDGTRPGDAFIDRLKRTSIFETAQEEPGYGEVPGRLIVELTTGCNLRCKTCYMSAAAPRSDEMTTGEVMALLETASRAGTETVALIGGEPFLRSDLKQLVAFALDRFNDVMISTNGTLADEDFLRRFEREGRLAFQVSLDGAEAASHDAIRGRGNFDRTSLLLDKAREHGLRTAVSAVLNRFNYSEVGRICDLAAEKGCYLAIVHKVHASGRARDFGEVVPSAAQLAHGMGVLLQKFDEYERSGRMIVDFPHNRCFRGDSTLDPALPGCHFGRASAYVTSEGNLATCSHLRDGEFLLGNVRERDLVELWRNSPGLDRMRRLSVDDLASCRVCWAKYLCRGSCRADALGASGSLEGDPPDCDALRAYYDYVLNHYARTMEPVTP